MEAESVGLAKLWVEDIQLHCNYANKICDGDGSRNAPIPSDFIYEIF